MKVNFRLTCPLIRMYIHKRTRHYVTTVSPFNVSKMTFIQQGCIELIKSESNLNDKCLSSIEAAYLNDF